MGKDLNIHTYIHTCIHTYIHTQLNTYIYTLTASIGYWVRSWDFLIHGHTVLEVGDSISGRGIIVGGLFHQTMQLARFS